ncbi:MAG TPA: NAD(P)/FAD-dependent oxidoreductase [Kofleriaceae bacterium]|jgi:glutathione reductase (NADPH)
MRTFDLIVIGGGNAGMAAASFAARAGWKVALVEERDLGGTCPNRGCVPKKVLVAAAEVVDHVRRAHGKGVTGTATIDWAALQASRHAIVDPLPARMAESLRSSGVEVVRGSATFVDRRVVVVGADRISARKVVIATGSAPRHLTIEGAERLVTSDDVLALSSVPRTVAFVGAGVIAFELSHVLARAGCERMVLLEPSDRPLARADAGAIDALVAYGRETLGIEVLTGVRVTGVAGTSTGVSVRYEREGATEQVDVDLAVNGAGRVARLEGLGLDHAGIKIERGRVALQPDLRCVDDPDVAIVGDAAPGLPQLSPLATTLGTLVGKNLVEDRHDAPDLRFVPTCVFTIPTLAQVGVTEAEAAERGLRVDVRRTEGMTGWISARTHHEELCYAKVLIDTDTKNIVGAHLIGHGADANIHLIAQAMRHQISAPTLGAMDTAYPTMASDLRYLL